MKLEDRINAISDFGFTERQARFLDLVMQFGGLCVPRQYASFADSFPRQTGHALQVRHYDGFAPEEVRDILGVTLETLLARLPPALRGRSGSP